MRLTRKVKGRKGHRVKGASLLAAHSELCVLCRGTCPRHVPRRHGGVVLLPRLLFHPSDRLRPSVPSVAISTRQRPPPRASTPTGPCTFRATPPPRSHAAQSSSFRPGDPRCAPLRGTAYSGPYSAHGAHQTVPAGYMVLRSNGSGGLSSRYCPLSGGARGELALKVWGCAARRSHSFLFGTRCMRAQPRADGAVRMLERPMGPRGPPGQWSRLPHGGIRMGRVGGTTSRIGTFPGCRRAPPVAGRVSYQQQRVLMPERRGV